MSRRSFHYRICSVCSVNWVLTQNDNNDLSELIAVVCDKCRDTNSLSETHVESETCTNKSTFSNDKRGEEGLLNGTCEIRPTTSNEHHVSTNNNNLHQLDKCLDTVQLSNTNNIHDISTANNTDEQSSTCSYLFNNSNARNTDEIIYKFVAPTTGCPTSNEFPINIDVTPLRQHVNSVTSACDDTANTYVKVEQDYDTTSHYKQTKQENAPTSKRCTILETDDIKIIRSEPDNVVICLECDYDIDDMFVMVKEEQSNLQTTPNYNELDDKKPFEPYRLLPLNSDSKYLQFIDKLNSQDDDSQVNDISTDDSQIPNNRQHVCTDISLKYSTPDLILSRIDDSYNIMKSCCHQCRVCPKIFQRATALARHERTHTDGLFYTDRLRNRKHVGFTKACGDKVTSNLEDNISNESNIKAKLQPSIKLETVDSFLSDYYEFCNANEELNVLQHVANLLHCTTSVRTVVSHQNNSELPCRLQETVVASQVVAQQKYVNNYRSEALPTAPPPFSVGQVDISQNVEKYVGASLTYSCSICCQQFAEKIKMTEHQRLHRPDPSEKCGICQETFKTELLLQHHYRCKHYDIFSHSVACTLCPLKCKFARDFVSHVRRHSGEKPYVCPQCGIRCINQRRLFYHVKYVHQSWVQVAKQIIILPAPQPTRHTKVASMLPTIAPPRVPSASKDVALHTVSAFEPVTHQANNVPHAVTNNTVTAPLAVTQPTFSTQLIVSKFVAQHIVCEKEAVAQQTSVAYKPLAHFTTSAHPTVSQQRDAQLLGLFQGAAIASKKVAQPKIVSKCRSIAPLTAPRPFAVAQDTVIVSQDVKKSVHGPCTYACFICYQRITEKIKLTKHQRISRPSPSEKCSICQLTFKTELLLQQHYRCKHYDISSHSVACKFCPVKCRRVSDFVGHVRTHTGEKPYECMQCGRRCINRRWLLFHVKNTHQCYGYCKCLQCSSNSFKQLRPLKLHRQMHIAKHVCTVCDVKYNSLNSLLIHRRFIHDIHCNFNEHPAVSQQTVSGSQAVSQQTVSAPQAVSQQTASAPQAVSQQTVSASRAVSQQTVYAPQAILPLTKTVSQRNVIVPQTMRKQIVFIPRPLTHCSYKSVTQHTASKLAIQQSINQAAVPLPVAHENIDGASMFRTIPNNTSHTVPTFLAVVQQTVSGSQGMAQPLQIPVHGPLAHACSICFKQFENIIEMLEHERLHRFKRGERCIMCHQTCNTELLLEQHYLCKHQDRSGQLFLCRYCLYTTKEVKHFVSHVRMHTGVRPYVCSQCEKGFPDVNQLVSHVKSTNHRYMDCKCSQCSNSIKQLEALKLDRQTHTGERTYLCGMCEMRYKSVNSLYLHMRCIHNIHYNINVHSAASQQTVSRTNTLSSQTTTSRLIPTAPQTRSSIVSLAQQSASVSQAVDNHSKTSAQGPLAQACSICCQWFAKRTEMMEHKRLHRPDPNGMCGICKKIFKTDFFLRKHYCSKHQYGSNQSFNCGFCSYTCKFVRNFICHVRLHTGEKPYVCTQCRKRFRSKRMLIVHIKSTHQIKRYNKNLSAQQIAPASKAETPQSASVLESAVLQSISNFSRPVVHHTHSVHPAVSQHTVSANQAVAKHSISSHYISPAKISSTISTCAMQHPISVNQVMSHQILASRPRVIAAKSAQTPLATMVRPIRLCSRSRAISVQSAPTLLSTGQHTVRACPSVTKQSLDSKHKATALHTAQTLQVTAPNTVEICQTGQQAFYSKPKVVALQTTPTLVVTAERMLRASHVVTQQKLFVKGGKPVQLEAAPTFLTTTQFPAPTLLTTAQHTVSVPQGVSQEMFFSPPTVAITPQTIFTLVTTTQQTVSVPQAVDQRSEIFTYDSLYTLMPFIGSSMLKE